MARMRTIEQLYGELRGMDPGTALTKTALRTLVTSGRIPSVRVGQKYLVSLEAVDAYLTGGQAATQSTAPGYGQIRPVDG